MLSLFIFELCYALDFATSDMLSFEVFFVLPEVFCQNLAKPIEH